MISFFSAEKRKRLEELVKAEEQLNQKVISEHKGKPIVFGTEVAFRHVDSEYYLSGEKDSSASRNTGYKCKLKKEFGKSSVFELTSFYKSKKSGDIINTNNSVLIKNINNGCFLNFDMNSPIEQLYRPTQAPEDPLRPDVQHTDINCALHPSFYSNDASVGWSFDRLVDNESPLKSLKLGSPIRGLDLIFLYHPELKAELCSDAIYHNGEPEVFFRKYTGQNVNELNSLNSLWQIEHLTASNQGGVFESIEHNEEVLTSKLTTSNFRLRHLITGRILALKSFDRENPNDNEVILRKEIDLSSKLKDASAGPAGKTRDTPEEDPDAISIGGMGKDNDSEEVEAGVPRSIFSKFNFEFVIMEERYLRNKCLVYLQANGTLV